MTAFTNRPYAGDADLQAMIDLLVVARPSGHIADYPSIVDLREMLDTSEVQANTSLWEDGNGQLVSFAIVRPAHGNLIFEIAPQARDGDLAAQMVAWSVERVRDVRPGAEEAASLQMSCRDDNLERVALLERLGFVRQEQYTLHFARPLSDPIPEPQVPEGFGIRYLAGEHEVEAHVALHRAAFGTENMTVEGRLSWMHTPDYAPELDLVAVAPDGTLAAYVFCSISAEENALTGRKDGYTDPVATHPAFQQRGLARALLLTGFRLLKQRGIETARTSTGSWNVAMQRAAQSVGYRAESKTIFFENRQDDFHIYGRQYTMKKNNNQNSQVEAFPRDLGDGLILRRATPADVDALADFNAQIHRDRGMEEPNPRVRAWVQDLMSGAHPTFRPEDFTLVEDTRTGAVVSSLNLISQTWAYEGIPFKVGRPELVGTHPDYRRRGLVRAQFEAIHRLSAERGEVVQAITGIPNYYRQFGYEMTMTLGGGRIGHKSHVPGLKEDESEPYRVRPATEDDLGFIAELYESIADRQPVHCPRDEARWCYELNGRSASSDSRRLLRVIESDTGDSVGFLTHSDWLWDKQMWLSMVELKPGTSWLAVTPSVIRYLWTTGEAYAARDEKECQAFGFGLGEEHPVYTAFASRLPEVRAPYAWYIRVADVVDFLRHVAPVLERRLAASDVEGYSGEIKVSFYRSGLLLKLEQGRLTEIADWSPEPSDWGNVAFPGLTFLHLLFGYRNCDELWHIFRDCWTDNSEVRSVMDRLFPKRPSCVWPID